VAVKLAHEFSCSLVTFMISHDVHSPLILLVD